jgi:two-component system, sensor histidine kinase RegB
MDTENGTHDAPWYLGATSRAALPWLARLRWTTALVEGCVVLVILALPHLDLPLDHLTWLIAAAGVANAVVAIWLSRRAAVPVVAAAGALAIDVALLTGLLELTGGPFNPFTVVYAVQVALAAVTLGAAWAWPLGAFATTCYGVLIYWHTTELVPGHHRLNDVPTHLLVMWITIAVTAELAAYFIVQASNALARRERELEQMRTRGARNERLASLTTLAAGAAHELSTPLGTIAIAARELERSVGTLGGGVALTDDARLIRMEVDRCQAILDQMSGRAGGIAPDEPEPVAVADLLSEIRDRLPPEQAARLQIRVHGAPPVVEVPRAGFRQVVTSLVKNAFDATADSKPVGVELTHHAEGVRITVSDEGPGMPSAVLSRAGEPFYTTKAPGRGLGLGLFLARVFAERFGGTLTLQSDRGTTAILELPARTGD